MAEIALHDVDRHAAVEQLGRPGVAHPMRALKVDQPAVRITDLKLPGKPAQQGPQRVGAVGLRAEAIGLPGDEQIPRRRRRSRVRAGQVLCQPALLLTDDVHHLPLDEDRVRRAGDL
jgi:hypothetical protein